MFRLIVCVLLAWTNHAYAQVKAVNLEDISALQENEERLVMVFIETNWCKYCKAMKHAIIKDEKVSAILGKRFYTVFFNAESTRPVKFSGKLFSYKPTGINVGVHELAEHLGTIDGQLSYPSLCFLDRDNEILFQYAGYLDARSLLLVLEKLSDDFR